MSNSQRPAVIDLIDRRNRETPSGIWLKFGSNQYTWSDLRDQTMRVANGLLDVGVRPGSRVAIMLHNSPEFLFVNYALIAIGAAPVPVNTQQRGGALRHIITDSQASHIVIEERLYREVVAPLEISGLGIIVSGRGIGHPSLHDMYSQPNTEPEITNQLGTGLGILYTSGTTGPPKGVVAEGYDLSAIEAVWGAVGVDEGETIYTCLPLFHGNALIISAMGSIVNGWTLALAERFSASRFWDDVRRHDAVMFTALGAMIPILLKQPPRSDDRDNGVRTVLSAACPAYAWRTFEERFDVRVIEFFGMVDAPGYLLNEDGVVGSMGKPVGGVEFRVVDDEDKPLGPGAIGELVFRHPSGRLTHYYGNDAATEEAYRGGWFHSGDLAEYNSHGYFFYRGRKKASIRRRGENISAWEIETVANQHPDVLESAACGVSSPLGEDEAKLIVTPKPGHSVDLEGVRAWCRGKMADYAVPRYLEVRDALPKTGTHRVAYGSLREEGVTEETWDAEAEAAVADRVTPGRENHA